MKGIGIAVILLSIPFMLEYDSMLLVAFSLLTGIGFIIAGSKLKGLMKSVDPKNDENQSLPE